jgi:hypothetical protein
MRTGQIPVYREVGTNTQNMRVPQPLPPHAQATPPSRPLRPGTAPAPTFRLAPPQAQRQNLQPRLKMQSRGLPLPSVRLILIAGAVITALIVLYIVVSSLIRAYQIWQDDLTYGRPRTMQMSQFVGHNETEGKPSHFIAQNLDRQITVVEYPGGDIAKARIIQGPKLFGKEAELHPVKIRFEDVNGDNHVDMLLSVDNQLIAYINEGGTFRPITGEERARAKIKGS